MDATLLSPPGPVAVRCECGGDGCGESLPVTQRQLARVRRLGRALVAHHHLHSLERVVGIADRYLVLEPPAPEDRR